MEVLVESTLGRVGDNVSNKYIAEQLLDCNVKSMLQRINASAPNVCLHCIYTAIYASNIAEKMNYNKRIIAEMTKGCLVHDLGKISIPPIILNRPKGYELSQEELNVIRLHPEFGELQTKDVFSDIVNNIVLLHHEKLDGSGYPNGIKDIPEYVQIVTVCDEFEALTSDRCYKPTFPKDKALKELYKEAKQGKLNKDIIDLLE